MKTVGLLALLLLFAPPALAAEPEPAPEAAVE